tara:strand:- start:428 stop:694 length:267 start_codon:yes stop_codon:yes gene_type:complete
MSHLPNVYAIINISDLGLINFSEVGESDATTIRKSVDELLFVIKWYNEHEPSFITNGSVVPTQILTHEQAIELMATIEWSLPMPENED